MGGKSQAAGPIYKTEGGSEAGFNTVELDGPNLYSDTRSIG